MKKVVMSFHRRVKKIQLCMCHALGCSLMITRGNESFPKLNITNEIEWHLHTSFPKLNISCHYFANFIPSKAILIEEIHDAHYSFIKLTIGNRGHPLHLQ